MRSESEYIVEFAYQAKNPPGGDPYIAACYQTILNLYETNQLELRAFVREVVAERAVTPKHFVNLFYRCLQYIELFVDCNPHYPADFADPVVWRAELGLIFENHRSLLQHMLLTRRTVTTLYQRYAGPKAAMRALVRSPKIRALDVGCGGNLGLPGLSLAEPFSPIIDHTPGGVLTGLLAEPLQIEGIAIDKPRAAANDFNNWLTACSFYPTELAHLGNFLSLLDRAAKVAEIEFVPCDFLLWEGNCERSRQEFDVVIMSTVLYQLGANQRALALNRARSLIGPDGIIIVQDFARKGSASGEFLNFDHDWFATPYVYRTFVAAASWQWEMKEVLQWVNARCKEARPGEDFVILLSEQAASVRM